MGNLSIVPAVPAADGAGAGSSTAALGLEKTIYIDGVFTGSVTLEVSNGNGYVPVASFTTPGRKTLKMAAQNMRIVRSATTAIPGTPAVTVSGNDDGAQFTNLVAGEPGASVDTKSFGTVNTIVVDGVINGVVQIQTSEDDAVWTDLCAFQAPGHQTLEIVARYLRVNHVNNLPVTAPTISVGAVNDDTAHKPLNVLVPAANMSIDVSLATVAHLTLDQNVTIDSLINCEAGSILTVAIDQGAGGNTVAWAGAAFQWEVGTAPVITAAAAARDLIRLTVIAVDVNGVATDVRGEFLQAYS